MQRKHTGKPQKQPEKRAFIPENRTERRLTGTELHGKNLSKPIANIGISGKFEPFIRESAINNGHTCIKNG